MTFTFETLPLENKEVLQKQILALFERDIALAPCTYNMFSYQFIFGEGCFPAIIRVEKEMPHNTVENMLSEMMWIDDLKTDIPNIGQPIPSVGNRLVERITVGEAVFLVSMFRKANGAHMAGEQWDARFFYNAGALIGKIHRTASEGYQRGFRYKRMHWEQIPFFDFAKLEGHFPPNIQQKAQNILDKIKSMPRDPRWYGMIFGANVQSNLFSDWGDLWASNFEECCYGFYIFDIASMVNNCIGNQSYAAKHPNMTPSERLMGEDGILTQLRAGYSSEYQLPDEHWDMIEDILLLSIAVGLVITIVYDAFPKELMDLYAQAVIGYFEDDKSPIDKVDQVQQKFISTLSPELRLLVEKEIPGLY